MKTRGSRADRLEINIALYSLSRGSRTTISLRKVKKVNSVIMRLQLFTKVKIYGGCR